MNEKTFIHTLQFNVLRIAEGTYCIANEGNGSMENVGQ
jgi:hypothetical protein